MTGRAVRWPSGGATGRATSAARRRRSSGPEAASELAEIVRGAARARPAGPGLGSGHSFTDIALTDGVMVRLDRLDRVLAVDREAGLVKVEAGIVLGELNRRLDELGLAFENLGDIDRQTLAGSISTGTHGTGARFRNVSAQVEAVELVLADGSSVEISAAVGPDGARAPPGSASARSGSSTRSRSGPSPPSRSTASTARGRSTRRSPSSTSSTTPTTTSSSTSSPTPRSALCRESRRTDEPPRPRSRAAVYAQEVVLENWVGQAVRARRPPLPLAGRRGSPASPPRGVGRSTKVDRSYRVFASERRIRFTEMEYGIPREHAAEAVRARARGRVATRASGRLPDRGPLRRRRRRHPQPLPRARHLLHRRPPGPQARLGAVLPRGRGDHGLLRRPPALGQAPLPDRRDARARATRAGASSRPCGRGSTPSGGSPTPTPSGCSARSVVGRGRSVVRA